VTILLGYGLRRLLLPDRVVWTGLERLAYFVLFPALLVHSLATADISPGTAWRLIAAVLGATVVTALAAFAVRRPLGLSGPAFASLFQGSIRMNTYVIFGVTGTLIGPAGLALASLTLAFMIVLVNVLSVLVLLRYGDHGESGVSTPARLLRSIAGNPLILACVLGVSWSISGIPMPALIGAPLSFVGSAAVGVALLSVGAALEPRSLFADGRIATATCVLKLLALPAVFLVLAKVLALDGQALLVGIVCASVPVATSSYIMTAQLGGDAKLMARLIMVTTLAAILTMLPWLALVKGTG
jgi:malonate transporter and related proteins